MNNPLVRENINGAFVILWCYLLVLIVQYMRRAIRRPRWYDEAGSKTAIAILIVMTGVAIRYGALWYQWIVFTRTGGTIQPHIAFTIIGGSLSIIGALCCIRIFSVASEGNRSWIKASAMTLAILTGLHFIR